MNPFKINLKAKVRDQITGYTGIVIGRTQWLYGCARYTVQAQELKDGKPVDPMSFDEEQLDVIDASEPRPERKQGGPSPSAARRPDVIR